MMRRLTAIAVGAVTSLVAGAGPAAAHGIGAQGDLPVPLWWVLYGAVAAIVFTFLLVARVRTASVDVQAPFPGTAVGEDTGVTVAPGTVVRVVGRSVGLLLLAVVAASAWGGGDLPAYAIHIGLWLVVPLVAAIVGDVYALLNPFAGLADLVERIPLGAPPAWLDRAGRYPAAIVLLGFGWLQLAHPTPSDPDVLLGFLAAYTAVMMLGALWWGRAWVDRADGFGVLFGLIGRLGVLQPDADGRLRLRPPGAGLSLLRPVRGTAAVLLVALGIALFDGLTRSSTWEDGVLGLRSGWSITPLNTLGFLVIVGVVALAYHAAASAAGSVVQRPSTEVAETFAPALVPLVLLFSVAHYVSLLVFDGQLLLALASDPLRLGWDLFGTARTVIDFTLMATTTVAWIQVVAVALGAVTAVVVAHDRAVARYDGEVAPSSQHALLGAIVLYSVAALVVLLGT